MIERTPGLAMQLLRFTNLYAHRLLHIACRSCYRRLFVFYLDMPPSIPLIWYAGCGIQI